METGETGGTWVFFLSDEEKRYLLKGLLPRSRELDVVDELRGWNWHRPPMEPVHPLRLGVYEVAGRYCPTGRDLFLRRVMKVASEPNRAMIFGAALHDFVSVWVTRSKRLLYQAGIESYRAALQALAEFPAEPGRRANGVQPELAEELDRRLRLVHDFEHARVVARVYDLLARQPYIGIDSLVALALPVVMEQRLDGSCLGLSRNLHADAITFCEPMVVDLKFGRPEQFHKLGITGYALVMEALYEFPMNIGCIVYIDFRHDRLLLERDFHIIDDECRQWFVEERDEKARMIVEELEPGTASECASDCPYFDKCR